MQKSDAVPALSEEEMSERYIAPAAKQAAEEMDELYEKRGQDGTL